MPSLARRRIAILTAARARRTGFLTLDPARLRFSLGTSLADLRVPFQFAPDARAIVAAAARELAAMLVLHHRFVPADERTRLVRAMVDGDPPPAPNRLAPTSGGPDLRAAARLGAAVHPALQGGMLCAWMGRGGRGRSLVGLAITAMKRALAESADTGHAEPTPLLVALALYAELGRAGTGVRDHLPAPPLDRYLGAAVLAGLWTAVQTGVVRALRDAGRAADDPLQDELEVALSPGALLGLRAPRPGGDLLYGMELATGVPRAEELAGALAAGGDPDAALAALAASVDGEGELARRAEQVVAVARLRERIAAAVGQAEAAGAPDLLAAARDRLAAPGALAAACAHAEGRAELVRELAREGTPGSHADGAALALRGWSEREPAAALGLDRADARAAWALAAGAFVGDLALERLAGPARRVVVADDASAEAAWQGGRAYRIAVEGPILRGGAERPLGHLFADVKDFTRRTTLLGRAPMIEFLREDFYRPILAAARPLHAATAHLGEEGTVVLNALLGDAVSLSGEVQAMVALARAIRAVLDASELRLRREVSREVARQLAAIEARHAAALEPVRRALADARAELSVRAPGTASGSGSGGGATARVAELAAEEARLAALHERELARARGEGLEAGVFVSFGPPPLTLTIEDSVFGHSRVAIAEKINESARGTARAPAARALADAALAEERAARRDPAIAHAWSVFVDAARPDEPGDLWNGGAALSEEALLAFLSAAGPARTVRRVRLEPSRIPDPLRARFFYGAAPLELVATYDAVGAPAELFRRVGRVAMKGLGDVTAWELAPEQGGAGALFQALGGGWKGDR